MKIYQIILIIINIQISRALLKINQYLPQNIYPLTLQFGNNLRATVSWPTYSGQITNINLYLYFQGNSLLSTNNIVFSSSLNYTINPQTLTYTANRTGNYFLRVDLQTGNLVSYQLQIFVNDVCVNNFTNLIIYPYFTFSIYSFIISVPTTVQLKYIGPSFPINIKNANQSVFSQTNLFFIPANQSNQKQIYNLTVNGTYYILIQHGISSRQQLIAFSLIVNEIPCKTGYIMNETIWSCVRNCSADINSYLVYSPWDVNQCYCFNGFQWDTINLICKAYSRCQYDMNVNGRLTCDNSGDYLNVNGNAPNDLFPIVLNSSDMLRVQGSWQAPANLYLILYSNGMNLLGPTCVNYSVSNGSSAPAILEYISTTAGTYYIRVDQSGGWHVNYNIKIIVNNNVLLLQTGLVTPPSYSWSAFHWVILRKEKVKISYTGPNYIVKIYSPTMSIFNQAVYSATFVGNTSAPIVLDVTDIGNWFAIVYHGMTSPIYNPLKFQLIVTPIKVANVFLDGFYFNRSISSYVRNCYTDPFSTNANPASDLSKCVCQSGFIWNTIFERCVRDCPTHINSNGQFIYSNCQSTPPNVIKNTSLYFPSNIYPVYLPVGSNLSVHLNWSITTNSTFLLNLYKSVTDFYAKISIPTVMTSISSTEIAIFYLNSNLSSSYYYVGVNSSSLLQINQITITIYINSQIAAVYDDYVINKTKQYSILSFDIANPTFVNLIFTSIDLGEPAGYLIYIFSPNQSIFGSDTFTSFQQSNISSVYHFEAPYAGKWFITVNSTVAIKNLNIKYSLLVTQKNCVKPSDIPQCQCVNNFYWNKTLMSCVRNCSHLNNSQLTYSITNISQCTCNQGYFWDDLQNICMLFKHINETDDQYYLQTVFGKILIFSSFNFVPALVKCLYLFFDDFWYYKFHRVEYPQTAKIFMEPVNIIYQFRVNPWFFKYVQVFNNITVNEYQQKQFNKFITENPNNPQSLYFLNNSSDLYIKNLLMNVLFFVISKMLCFLFFILSFKCQKLKKIYIWMVEQSRWWSLIRMNIQSNLVVIAFSSSLQLLIPNSINFSNKYNMIISLLYLFLAIFYSLVFYQIIFRFQSKKSAQGILIYSFYAYKNFRFQSFAFLTRTITRGMIQGLSFQNYQHQIIALAASDLIFTVLVFSFRYQFCHIIVFLSAFLYNLLFLCLDTIFVLHYKYPLLFTKVNYNLLVYGLIWSIIGSYCLIFIFLTLVKLGDQFTLCRKQTKIQSYKITGRSQNLQKKTNKIDLFTKETEQQLNHNQIKKRQYQNKIWEHCLDKTIKKYEKYPLDQFSRSEKENKSYIPVEKIKINKGFKTANKIDPKFKILSIKKENNNKLIKVYVQKIL